VRAYRVDRGIFSLVTVGLRGLICTAGVEYSIALTGDTNVALHLTSCVDGRIGLNSFN